MGGEATLTKRVCGPGIGGGARRAPQRLGDDGLSPHERWCSGRSISVSDQGSTRMSSKGMVSCVAGTVAAVLVGCGGGSSRSALRDPGFQGVNALRQAIRTALMHNDASGQCDLFAPSVLQRHGGSVDSCVAWLSTGNGPYRRNAQMYVAGGHIEISGNEASYRLAPYSFPSEGPGGSGLEPPEPLTVFTAVYTEDGWRIVENPE